MTSSGLPVRSITRSVVPEKVSQDAETLARALQVYQMIVINGSYRMTVSVEDDHTLTAMIQCEEIRQSSGT